MMTSENYTTPKKYKVEGTTGCLYDKENNIKDTAAYLDDSTAKACETTDISSTENANESSSSRRCRTRRSRDQISDESSRNSEELPLEGATAAVEKPKSLKKEKPSGKKRKERKNLREKRRSTGVVIMPGAAVSYIVCVRLDFDFGNLNLSCISLKFSPTFTEMHYRIFNIAP